MAHPIPGDEASVSVLVEIEPEQAFRVFTEEIDRWWRAGPAYRILGKRRSIIRFEPRAGGRLFESVETDGGERVVEAGLVAVWDPPARLVFEWRGTNLLPSEKTEVEVRFEPSASGTLVTLKHRGWSRIRADHPVRHGQDVPVFLRTLGLFWAELLSSMRELVACRGQRGEPE
jgi:uncharacterized protein YndB with AHSA1/START domain